MIDSFYFAIRGVGAFVLSDENHQMFALIDPMIYSTRKKNKGKDKEKGSVALQYFGAEDLVINVAA